MPKKKKAKAKAKAKHTGPLTLKITELGKTADGRHRLYSGQLGSTPIGTVIAKSAAKATRSFRTIVRKAI